MTSPLLPPLWLQLAVGHAERLGRDFLARPLADREARTLGLWQARGVSSHSAGTWLSRPPWAQEVQAEVRSPAGGGAA